MSLRKYLKGIAIASFIFFVLTTQAVRAQSNLTPPLVVPSATPTVQVPLPTSQAALAQSDVPPPVVVPPTIPVTSVPGTAPVVGAHGKWHMLTFGAQPQYSLLFGSSWGIHDRGSPMNNGLMGTIDFQYRIPISPSTKVVIGNLQTPLYLVGSHSVVPLILPNGKQIGSVDLSKGGANTSVKSTDSFVGIWQGLLETKRGLLPSGVLQLHAAWSSVHGGVPGVGQFSTQWTPESGFVTATNQSQYWSSLLEYVWLPTSRLTVAGGKSVWWFEHSPGGANAGPQHISTGLSAYVQYTIVPRLLDVAYLIGQSPNNGPGVADWFNSHSSQIGLYIYGPKHTLVQLSAGNFYSASDTFGPRALVCANPPTCSKIAPYLGGTHAFSYQIKFGFGLPVLSPL